MVFSYQIHEIGHLVFGLATGYTFSYYSFLSFAWMRKKDGKVVFCCNKNSFSLGKCLMAPPKKEEFFRFKAYTLGGGLANLFLAIIVFSFLIFFRHWSFPIWTTLFLTFLLNFILALQSLIPF